MSVYRIYPLDAAGRILPPQDAECADDDAAIRYARELSHKVKDGCEVWHVTRFVGRFHFKPIAETSAAL